MDTSLHLELVDEARGLASLGLDKGYDDLLYALSDALEAADAEAEKWHSEAGDWQQAKSEADAAWEESREQLDAMYDALRLIADYGHEMDDYELPSKEARKIARAALERLPKVSNQDRDPASGPKP